MNIDSRRHEHTSCVPEGVLGPSPGRGSGSDRESGPRLVAEGPIQRRMVSIDNLVPWVQRRCSSGGVVAGGERDFAGGGNSAAASGEADAETPLAPIYNINLATNGGVDIRI